MIGFRVFREAACRLLSFLKPISTDLTLARRGKVRDVYDLGEHLLIVATDRISAFDYVLGSGIPDKGKVLTQLSAFWFDHVGDLVPHHRRRGRRGHVPCRRRGRIATSCAADRCS